MDSKDLARQNHDLVVRVRRDLHRHPEASFEEFYTTKRLAEELDAIGIPYRKFEPTGLLGEIVGSRPGKTVALRGDIDALSITEKTELEYASENDGFMHACGHDTHAAMLLGAAKALYENRQQLAGTVKILFQPAEEIARGAAAVIKQGALEGVDMIFGLHIGAMIPPGVFEVCEGASHAAANTFKITVEGTACHGAMPHEGADATVAASALVMNLQTIASREVSPMDPVAVTVGSLFSGSRFNIVSGSAVMEGTTRTFSREVNAALPGIIERIAKKTAEAYRCSAETCVDRMTDVLLNDDEAAGYARRAAEKVAQKPGMVRTARPTMGAEDFAEYTACIKGGFVSLGGGGSHPHHSDFFHIEEDAMESGTAWYIQVACDYLEQNA